MPESYKSNSHSMRYFLLMIAVITLGWKVITGFHDIFISYEGSLCVERQLGKGFYEHWTENQMWRKKNRWNEAAISYIDTLFRDSKNKELALEKLQQNCSDYIYVTQIYHPSIDNTPMRSENVIFVNNWALNERDPAISDKRTKSMILWAFLAFICIVDFRKLKKIFIWSRD